MKVGWIEPASLGSDGTGVIGAGASRVCCRASRLTAYLRRQGPLSGARSGRSLANRPRIGPICEQSLTICWRFTRDSASPRSSCSAVGIGRPMTLERSPSTRSTSDGAEALDRVGAGPIPPLAGGDVAVDLDRRSARGSATRGADQLGRTRPRRGISATPPSTSWVAAREGLQARPGAAGVRRPCRAGGREDDVGVDAEDELRRASATPRRALRRAFSTTTAGGGPRRVSSSTSGSTTSKSSAEQRRAAPAAAARRRRGPASDPLRPVESSGNQIADLALGRLVGVGAVDEVEGDLGAEVAADRAGLGLDRVGGADQLAGRLDGLDALEHAGDERAAGDERDELAEERLVGVLGVVLVGDRLVGASSASARAARGPCARSGRGPRRSGRARRRRA